MKDKREREIACRRSQKYLLLFASFARHTDFTELRNMLEMAAAAPAAPFIDNGQVIALRDLAIAAITFRQAVDRYHKTVLEKKCQ
jgi:hypothetical protein